MVPCSPFLAKYAGAGQCAGLDEQRGGGDGDGGEEGVQYGCSRSSSLEARLHSHSRVCIQVCACAFQAGFRGDEHIDRIEERLIPAPPQSVDR
ncbi:hypothetical protein FIBSPDRAFT_497116 [Athelia psychrophila]|uniref:Uncharacterized protein n=1 Tax=Athelia psychrophila TaxID=1759441 RepID=A0A166KDB5_9AGAM|nr:hypothetical protein FIBSPDRAFT_497116 [Fibularhizoctonia sp. CBS 109695]